MLPTHLGTLALALAIIPTITIVNPITRVVNSPATQQEASQTQQYVNLKGWEESDQNDERVCEEFWVFGWWQWWSNVRNGGEDLVGVMSELVREGVKGKEMIDSW